jgi:uncharacterized delta-60 repeat protein
LGVAVAKVVRLLLFYFSTSLALLAQASGDLDLSFNPGTGPEDTIYALALQTDGKILVGGAFLTWDGSPRSGLVRLNADGSLDPSFNARLVFRSSDRVMSIAVTAQGLIYVGGSFSSSDGLSRLGFTRLTASGVIDPSFRLGDISRYIGEVTSVILDSAERPIIAGNLDIPTPPRTEIVRFLPSGAMDESYGPLFGSIFSGVPGAAALVRSRSSALSSDGRLVLARPTIGLSGVFRSLYWFTAGGAWDTTPPPFADISINTVAFTSDGSLLAGGNSSSNGRSLYRFSANGKIDPSFAPIFNPSAQIFCQSDDSDHRIIVGGDFTQINGQPRSALARLSAEGVLDPRFATGLALNGEVHALARDAQGRLIIAGAFTRAQSRIQPRIARLNDPALPPYITAPPAATGIAIHGNVHLRVGTFPEPGLTYQWSKDGQPIPGETNADLYLVDVQTAARYQVVVSNANGTVTPPTVDVTVAPRITGGVDPAFAPVASGIIIPRPDGRLYIGSTRGVRLLTPGGDIDPSFNLDLDKGPFGTAELLDGVVLSDGRLLLRLKRASSTTLERYLPNGTWDPSFALSGAAYLGGVTSFLVLADGSLLLGGRFTPAIASVPVVVLARANADGRIDPAFQAPTFEWPSQVTSLVALPSGSFMAQGDFRQSTAPSLHSVLRFLPSGAIDPSWKPFDFYLRLLNDGTVYRVDLETSQITRLGPDGTDDPSFYCLPQRVLQLSNSTVVTFSRSVTLFPLSDGRLLLSGDFGRINGVAAASYARLNSDGSLDSSFPPPTFNIAGSTRFVEIGRQLYAVGSYTQINGYSRPGLSRLFQESSGVSLVVNLSARARTDAGANPLIAGFVLSGTLDSPVLLRGIGPTLKTFGLADSLSSARLDVFQNDRSVGTNSGWSGAPGDVATFAQRVGAFPLPPGSADAALALTLPGGAYTAKVTPVSGSGGVALAEVYTDPARSNTRLVNLAARAEIRPGTPPLTAGFTISGTGEKQVLIRVVGPTLATFGVEQALASPRLKLFNATGLIDENSAWSSDASAGFAAAAARAVGAFVLPTNSRDAAILRTLRPGSYTITAESADASSGIALIEIYEVTR